jgi:hypothetical protein
LTGRVAGQVQHFFYSSGEGEKLISGEEVLGIWSMCVTETEKFFPCGTTIKNGQTEVR